MELSLERSDYRIFSVSPRPRDGAPQQYWSRMRDTIDWSESYGCTGMLIFVANDSAIDPWVMAQSALARTRRFCPLVAVNPVYMHPFTAAKMIFSLTWLYERRVYLNLVAGAALSHLDALNEHLSSEERYARLAEYVRIVMDLLTSRRPVTFKGTFYAVNNLQLPCGVPPSLLPECLISGQSEAARSLSERLGLTRVQTLQQSLEAGVESSGIYFGLVTRPDEGSAWAAANDLFPADAEGQSILDASMSNTDSVWKHKLRKESERPALTASGFWLGPFLNHKSDGPYFVGSYKSAASLIAKLMERGVDTFILELAPNEREYEHAAVAFAMAGRPLAEPAAAVQHAG